MNKKQKMWHEMTSEKKIDTKIEWAKTLSDKLRMPKFDEKLRSAICFEVDNSIAHRRTPSEVKKLDGFAKRNYKKIVGEVDDFKTEFNYDMEIPGMDVAITEIISRLHPSLPSIIRSIAMVHLIDYYRRQPTSKEIRGIVRGIESNIRVEGEKPLNVIGYDKMIKALIPTLKTLNAHEECIAKSVRLMTDKEKFMLAKELINTKNQPAADRLAKYDKEDAAKYKKGILVAR